MKTLDVQALHNAIDQTLEQLKKQSEEFAKVKESVDALTSLDDALKGKGGEAIRSFYEECHTPFLRFYESFIDEYESALKKIKNALNSLEPNHNGYISQAFLEHDLEQGLNEANAKTFMLVSKADAAIAKVSHIVDLPALNDNDFHEQNRKALTDINQTIEKLHTFDREQTNALKNAENDLETMQTYIARLEKMYTGPKIEITGYQKGAILKPDDNTNINSPVGGLKGELENAESSAMKTMLEKLGEQKDSNVDTLATPNRVKKLIEKYKIRNESVYNIDKYKKFMKYKIKTPEVQVKKFEIPWGPGKIGKFGKASEIRKALTENPLKIDEVSKVEKGTKTAKEVSKNQVKYDATNIALYLKYKEVLKTTELANPLVDSLRNTGKLPPNFVGKAEAAKNGWRPGKALNNYISGSQIGGDVFKNSANVLPKAPGRVWYEADVGLSNTMSRSKQPGTRLLYSNDGQMYITTDHYKTVHFIGTFK
ncbi:T7SS effector LXG polymorphic toxin [Bacillus sp. FSL M8-0168]|uniref:T7SS effector LXG polymorphic toxin n=1 Tax=Bacillus sp. FSL M8-0168 TaxID=2921614 RepID=UPI0030FD4777